MPEINNNMKVLKKFNSYSSHVELIELEGKEYILKTVDKEEAVNEQLFLMELSKNKLPSLEIFNNPVLKDNQLLLEYIPGSEKIDFNNAEQVKQWGEAAKRMHDIKFDKAFRITDNGEKEYLVWNDFLRKHIEHSSTSRMDGRSDLSNEQLLHIKEYVEERLNFDEQSYSLLHGDMHDGNTLKRENEIIIYDKNSEIFAGHYLYDLAIVATMYPNGVYIHTDDPEYKSDAEMLNAFMEGYGENFIETQKENLDLYMLIRNLDRYPNPFVKVEKDIFNTILGED